MSTKITFDDITLTLDLTINEKHKRTGDSTEHIIEDGSTKSDHIILSPDSFSISGFLSEIPYKNIDDPQIKIFNELDEARKNKKIFIVETFLKTYENVCLTGLDCQFTEDLGKSILLDLTFKQMDFTQAKETKAPKEKIGKAQTNNTVKNQQDRFSSKTSKGQVNKATPNASQQTKINNAQKPVTNPNKATPQQNKSYLSSILGY